MSAPSRPAAAADGASPDTGAATPAKCPVETWNEWDPLEEVIVGRIDGAAIPPNHVMFTGSLPKVASYLYRPLAGRRYPRLVVGPAQRELDEFVHILEAEGITVRRPEPIDFRRRFRTPDWRSSGFCTASPRDGIIVVGDEMIETPMAWRSRHFEMHAYRKLLREYFDAGARWTAAPKPQLLDSLFDADYVPPRDGEAMRYIINESEVVFDAADFVRCGRDLFYTRSNVTNDAGVAWLRRHLGDGFRIHEVKTRCRQPMHIDTTFMPLAPGKVLVNPDFIDVNDLPDVLKGWDVLVAPEPPPGPSGLRFYLSLVSRWIGLNVLMLDEQRVVVERTQTTMIAALRDWGFEPVICPFVNYKMFGGGFHCATLDVRRRGTLQSYF